MQQVLFSLSPPAQRLQEIESALIKASIYQKENILLIQNILQLNDAITYSGHLLIKRKIKKMAASQVNLTSQLKSESLVEITESSSLPCFLH